MYIYVCPYVFIPIYVYIKYNLSCCLYSDLEKTEHIKFTMEVDIAYYI